MTDTISLQEAFTRIKDDPFTAQTDPQVLQLISDVDGYATDILSDKDDEFILGCITLSQAICMGALIQNAMSRGDFSKASKLIGLMMSDEFAEVTTMIFKASIGIAALEELR